MLKTLVLAGAAATVLMLAGDRSTAQAQQAHWFYDQPHHDVVAERRFRREMRRRARRRAWLRHFRKRHYGRPPIAPGYRVPAEEYFEPDEEVVIVRPRRRWRERDDVDVYDLPPGAPDYPARYDPDVFEDEEFAPRRKWRAKRKIKRRKVVRRSGPVPKPKARPSNLVPERDRGVEVTALDPVDGGEPDEPRVKTYDKPVVKKRIKKQRTPKDALSCAKARSVITGFGFSEVTAKSCTGSVYDFAAKRDGKPFSIKLSAKTGELKQVRRLNTPN